MEKKRRIVLFLILVVEVSGLVFASFILSSDTFFVQRVTLHNSTSLCVGNITCHGEITLGLFTGWKALDSGLGIKGREQYFTVFSSKPWQPELILWILSASCLVLSGVSALVTITLTVINIAMIPIETRHGPLAVWILNLVAGVGLNLSSALYTALIFSLLPQGHYLSEEELERGWTSDTIQPQFYLWLSLPASVPFYMATLITWLVIENECSTRCSRQPKIYRTDTNFESSEMILY